MLRTSASPPAAPLAIAIATALLGGFVDGFALTSLGGHFAALAGANLARLGAALGGAAPDEARMLGALLLAFLAGVIGAATAGRLAGGWPRTAAAAAGAVLIALAAGAAPFAPVAALLLLAAAMGAENGGPERPLAPWGLAGFTLALARFGRGLAGALMGDRNNGGWTALGLVCLAFALGAISGARTALAFGPAALWVAAVVAALLAVLALREDAAS